MFKNRFFNLLVAVALLTVFMLTVQEVLATKAVVSDVESASQFYAANPELMVADRYNTESNAAGELVQLAINPELSSARRHSENIGSADSSLAINPELAVANRYAASQKQIYEAISLSQNPELSVARRFADTKAGK